MDIEKYVIVIEHKEGRTYVKRQPLFKKVENINGSTKILASRIESIF